VGKNVQFFKTYFLLKSTREKDSGWVESDFDIETKFLSTVIVEEKKCCLLSVSQTIFFVDCSIAFNSFCCDCEYFFCWQKKGT